MMISPSHILMHAAWLLMLAVSVQGDPGPGPQQAASEQQATSEPGSDSGESVAPPQDVNPDTATIRLPDSRPAAEDPERLARLKRYSAAEVEAELAATRVEQEAMLNRMETVISREELDEQWSPTTEGQLRTSFQHAMTNTEPNAGQAAVLVSVICRSTLCRIELAQTASGSPTDGIMETAMAHWSGAIVVSHPTELTTVIYAARPERHRTRSE
jgi:hypothetical protein